jgi:UDP-glucose 4-epimerase
MTKVLITGAAGLIGSQFARHLLDRDYEVVAVDNLAGGYRDFVDPRADFREVDITHSSAVDELFAETRPDFVYHFAAYAAVGLSPFIRSFNYTNNVVASANVINACVNHAVNKIVFTSSMDVYGSLYAPPYTEDFIPMPEDPYGIAKYAVELDLRHARRLFGLNYAVVRPHNVFGINQNIWDKYRNVLGIWIRQTLSGQPITVFGDGSQTRSFSDVKYYMDPFEVLMKTGDGETYNMGADSHMTILEAAARFRHVASKMGHDARIVQLESRDEVRHAYCDHSKAKRDLGFVDDTDFEDLVEKMFVWAKGQPPRPVKMMNYEITKGMYDFWKK